MAHHVELIDQTPGAIKLFTPGPLNTSATVKTAMLHDIGSKDREMTHLVKGIRNKLVDLAGVSHTQYTCVPLEGSGTFTVEAVLNTTIPKELSSRVLIMDNGRYGERMEIICKYMGVEVHSMGFPEYEPITAATVRDFLRVDNKWTNIAIVHSETTTGIINHVEEIGLVIKEECPEDTIFIVDGMSSFPVIPLNLEGGNIDFLVSSANKCFESVPGFAYTICRIDKLMLCKGRSSSLALDLTDQYETLKKNGQFRFTAPTHCLLAFHQALKEFDEEGGQPGRTKRYQLNNKIVCDQMTLLGFKTFIGEQHRGYVITSFQYPDHPNWNFHKFYMKMAEHGQVICPGKTVTMDTFRIGNIGHLFADDMYHLIDVVKKVLHYMDIETPVRCQ